MLEDIGATAPEEPRPTLLLFPELPEKMPNCANFPLPRFR